MTSRQWGIDQEQLNLSILAKDGPDYFITQVKRGYLVRVGDYTHPKIFVRKSEAREAVYDLVASLQKGVIQGVVNNQGKGG